MTKKELKKENTLLKENINESSETIESYSHKYTKLKAELNSLRVQNNNFIQETLNDVERANKLEDKNQDIIQDLKMLLIKEERINSGYENKVYKLEQENIQLDIMVNNLLTKYLDLQLKYNIGVANDSK